MQSASLITNNGAAAPPQPRFINLTSTCGASNSLKRSDSDTSLESLDSSDAQRVNERSPKIKNETIRLKSRRESSCAENASTPTGCGSRNCVYKPCLKSYSILSTDENVADENYNSLDQDLARLPLMECLSDCSGEFNNEQDANSAPCLCAKDKIFNSTALDDFDCLEGLQISSRKSLKFEK